MQAHVGAGGSKNMLEHFESMVPPNSTPATLLSALNDEYQPLIKIGSRRIIHWPVTSFLLKLS
jgi:hypothetical protein